MRFEKKNREKTRNFFLLRVFFSVPADDGVWVDLTDLKDRKGDGEAINETNPFAAENVDQAIFESVLESLPAWKEKKPTSAFHQHFSVKINGV